MYFPYQKGRYEVAPGLLPLSQDFGNGPWDQRLIQLGDDFPEYRKQFEENRAREEISKYVCLSPRADAKAVGAISEFVLKKMSEEYPDQVRFQNENGKTIFTSDFTNESFVVNAEKNSVEVLKGKIAYVSAWDAMGAQVPEDLAIWRLSDDGSEEMEALHLNAPNHWAASEKIGRSFAAVHAPIPHIEKIVQWAVNLFKGIVQKGPYVRFAWGVGTDERLNHHPFPPKEVNPKEWAGRRFDPSDPKLYARVERQVLWGFPDLNRIVFGIRTYHQDVKDLKKTHPEAVSGLIEAILSMSPESLVYKGLSEDRDQVVEWLRKI
jgi:hypothetical protein